MAEILPDGTFQNYGAFCPICKKEIEVNFQGKEIGKHICKPKYDIIIAIDPDVEKSGVAFLEVATRKLDVSSLTFPQLLDYLQWAKSKTVYSETTFMAEGMTKPVAKIQEGKKTIIVVEAGWLNRSNWHLKSSDTKRIASAKGNSTGRNHETGRKIVEMAKHYGFEVHEQIPLRKCWKGKDGKITHEELASFTGLMGKTNQDARDAALLAWTFANLPIRFKC